jgi:polysaccharide biosynthesis/export protein
MIARMLPSPRRWQVSFLLGLALSCVVGCHGLAKKHEAKSIPQFGEIDASQAGELRKIALQPYAIEPPDELEIVVRPPFPDWSAPGSTTFTVQADGVVDLGFGGNVYVYGLTLAEAEERIATHLNGLPQTPDSKPSHPYQVSVRLANGQSKYYYVIGVVTTQGRFKVTGGETVLDAILLAGLRTNSLPDKAYLVRPHPLGGPDQVLKVDWCGIKDRGDTLTNYQIMPGDRVIVPGTKPPGLLGSLLGN